MLANGKLNTLARHGSGTMLPGAGKVPGPYPVTAGVSFIPSGVPVSCRVLGCMLAVLINPLARPAGLVL